MGKIQYNIELEVLNGDHCPVHNTGTRFLYPDDIGKICPFMLESMHSMILVLQFGGRLPWKYKGSCYEKEIGPEGLHTEYIRCPDPTDHGIVMKLTRKAIEDKEVSWC